MDYCNCLLYGVKSNDLRRLRSLQHKAAKLIFCAPRRSDPTLLMNSLHWLPLSKRIKFKLYLLIYKCLNDCTPPSFIDTMCRKTTASKGPVTRPAKDKTHLIKPRCNKIIGDKSFAVAGPSIWNSLSGAFVKRLPSLFLRRCSRRTYLIYIYFFTCLVFHCYNGSLFDDFLCVCTPLYLFLCARLDILFWIGAL